MEFKIPPRKQAVVNIELFKDCDDVDIKINGETVAYFTPPFVGAKPEFRIRMQDLNRLGFSVQSI